MGQVYVITSLAVATRNTKFGPVTIAGGPYGIYSVNLGLTGGAYVTTYDGAGSVHYTFDDEASIITRYIDDPSSYDLSDLVVHYDGTEFQKSVWYAIQRIPFGMTRTYKQLAETIGKPTAWRAVAVACSKNPLAFVVPCHRVVGNKSKTGFRWGTDLKRQLLAREGVNI